LEKIEMKKTLVAIAALAAVTGAMAQVTISGIVDQSVTRIITKDSSASTTATTTSIGSQYTGADLNIGGSEDLGNGLTARFNVGMFLDADESFRTAAGYAANYQSFVGIAGGFGDIQIGQFFSVMHSVNASYDAAGYSQVNTSHQVTQGASGAVGGNLGQLVANHVQYTLPKLVDGLTVKVSKAYGEAAFGDQTQIGAMYSAGGFGAGYAQSRESTSATTTTAKSSYGLSYDFGVAKVVYSAQARKLSTAATGDTGTQYGVIVPFGALSIGVSMTSYKMPSLAVNTGGSGYNVLAKYDLSKRTALIAQTGRDTIDTGTNKGDTSAQTSFGLWHSF